MRIHFTYFSQEDNSFRMTWKDKSEQLQLYHLIYSGLNMKAETIEERMN